MLNETTQRTIEEARALREQRLIATARTIHLTKSERAVLTQIADGVTNDEMAARLGISAHTAKFHVNNLLTKLSARSRLHAVCIAFRAGLVS